MINKKLLPQEILLIGEKIKEEEGELFLVGGSVRDLVMGRKPLEYDFEIYGNPEEKKKYSCLNTQEKEKYLFEFIEKTKEVLKTFGDIDEKGKNFGVIKMSNKPYDFSFPRKENKSGISRKDYEISLNPFLDFKEAQKRRDITINTLMYSFNRHTITDNFNALSDIKNKIIRIVDPITFVEDPLRVYRIAQFVSRLEFTVEKETIELCKKMDLNSLSVERIHWETEKLFNGKDIVKGLLFLRDTDVFLKRHLDFLKLFTKNSAKHKYINHINSYTSDKMKMTEKIVFIFILFLEKKNFESYLLKVSKILETFTKNKKDIKKAIQNIKSAYSVIEYLSGKITFEEIFLDLLNKDLTYLDLYVKFWIRYNNGNGLRVNEVEIEDLINKIINFNPLVTGKDLIMIGFEESEKFQAILQESIRMQIKGLNKNEILNLIKRRDKR